MSLRARTAASSSLALMWSSVSKADHWPPVARLSEQVPTQVGCVGLYYHRWKGVYYGPAILSSEVIHPPCQIQSALVVRGAFTTAAGSVLTFSLAPLGAVVFPAD